eukprot:TCALIF_12169-PA protein Name:"Protein of unknown function" AED:0.29 eAED:0.29 QI:0/0.5/0.66/0.66/0/0.33/3/6/149
MFTFDIEGCCFFNSINNLKVDRGKTPSNAPLPKRRGRPPRSMLVSSGLKRCEIPGAINLVGGATLPMMVPVVTQNRICGQVFSSVTGNTVAIAYDAAIANMMISICSQTRPFEINFKSSPDEATMPNREDATAPGGIIGFSLNYQQIPC